MIPTDRRLQLIKELREFTERQLMAARRLDVETMQQLNELRSDHLFNLEVALQDPVPEDTTLKEEIVSEVKALQQLEMRLIQVSEIVLRTFEQMTPYASPQTYGAAGRLTS